MKLLLTVCLTVLLVGLPLYLLYWNLFRPVIIKRLKYLLYQARDEMRLMLISGEIGQKEKAYPLIEHFCNMAISKVENVDFVELLPAKYDKRIELEAQRDIEIILESPLAIRKKFYQMTATVFGAACVNSPGLVVLLVPILVAILSVFWFNKTKIMAISYIRRAFGSFYLRPA